MLKATHEAEPQSVYLPLPVEAAGVDLTVDFLTAFLCFLVEVAAGLVWVPLAGGLAGAWAANVNGIEATANAIGRIIFFMAGYLLLDFNRDGYLPLPVLAVLPVLFLGAFLELFLCFLAVSVLDLVWVPLAGGLAGAWAANIKGIEATAKTIGNAIFFMVSFLPAGSARLQSHLAAGRKETR